MSETTEEIKKVKIGENINSEILAKLVLYDLRDDSSNCSFDQTRIDESELPVDLRIELYVVSHIFHFTDLEPFKDELWVGHHSNIIFSGKHTLEINSRRIDPINYDDEYQSNLPYQKFLELHQSFVSRATKIIRDQLEKLENPKVVEK